LWQAFFILLIINLGILIFIVPTFVRMFNDVGLALPLPTQIAVSISHLLTRYWFLWLGGAAISYFINKHLQKKTHNTSVKTKIEPAIAESAPASADQLSSADEVAQEKTGPPND